MISRGIDVHCADVLAEPETAADSLALNRRVEVLVEEYLDFVWRSLRSLGVERADCDDGCQKVWWVVARRVSSIEVGKERSFIFSVVLRVASEMRRSAARGSSVPLENDLISDSPDVDELCDQRRARTLLSTLLENMPWEQRVVFVMFELEGLSSVEVAGELAVPRGTVASRLRLAREYFNRALARYQSRSRGAVGGHSGELQAALEEITP